MSLRPPWFFKASTSAFRTKNKTHSPGATGQVTNSQLLSVKDCRKFPMEREPFAPSVAPQVLQRMSNEMCSDCNFLFFSFSFCC